MGLTNFIVDMLAGRLSGDLRADAAKYDISAETAAEYLRLHLGRIR